MAVPLARSLYPLISLAAFESYLLLPLFNSKNILCNLRFREHHSQRLAVLVEDMVVGELRCDMTEKVPMPFLKAMID